MKAWMDCELYPVGKEGGGKMDDDMIAWLMVWQEKLEQQIVLGAVGWEDLHFNKWRKRLGGSVVKKRKMTKRF